MSSRINLLTAGGHYRQKVRYFAQFRLFSLILGFLAFGTILSSFFFAEYKRQEIKQLESETQAVELESNLVVKQNKVAARIATGSKTIAASTDYLPLYTAIVGSGQFASTSAQLQRVEIDSQRNLDLRVNFQSKEALISFLGFVESSEFEGHFQSILINDINVSALQSGPTELLLKALFNGNENIQ